VTLPAARQARPGRLRGLVLPGLLTFLALAVLVSLGNWQMRRLAWKGALIEAALSRPDMPAAPLPAPEEWNGLDIAALEYRPFRLTGRFLHDREALVFTNLSEPRGPHGGVGYWVVTPFALAGGGTVLVNRGFVPEGRQAEAARGGSLEDGDVTIEGLLRPDDPANLFTPAARPERNLYYRRNIAAIAAAKGLEGPVAPFTIDLTSAHTPPSGLPQAGETRLAFTNNHLGYAITWYGLALALIGVFASFAWARLRGRR
jgi:surfeit locus 1 family protein